MDSTCVRFRKQITVAFDRNGKNPGEVLLTQDRKSPILIVMRVIAWTTLFSLLFLSFHVVVDHHEVDGVCAKNEHFHSHSHSEVPKHSHSHEGHHPSSDDSDSVPKHSSHDPAAHDHEDTLLRGTSGNGMLASLSLHSVQTLRGPLLIPSILKTFNPTFEVIPPPFQGKTFLSLQSLLI